MKVGNRRNLKDGPWGSRKHKKRVKKKKRKLLQYCVREEEI